MSLFYICEVCCGFPESSLHLLLPIPTSNILLRGPLWSDTRTSKISTSCFRLWMCTTICGYWNLNIQKIWCEDKEKLAPSELHFSHKMLESCLMFSFLSQVCPHSYFYVVCWALTVEYWLLVTRSIFYKLGNSYCHQTKPPGVLTMLAIDAMNMVTTSNRERLT